MTADKASSDVEASGFDTRALANLSRAAIEAVDGLWESHRRTFWRDSAQRDQAGGAADALYPTVTCRCVEELVAASAKVADFAIGDDRLNAMCLAVVETDPGSFVEISELGYAPFTLASATACCGRVAASPLAASQPAQDSLEGLAKLLVASLNAAPISEIHPFVRFHSLRALSVAGLDEIEALSSGVASTREMLLDAIRHDTSGLLAKHYMATISPAEHVVLAFCGAALARTGNPNDLKTALAALQAAASAQDSAGCWPLGRVVRTEPSRLEISTYEVAWAIADGLLRLVEAGLAPIESPETAWVMSAIDRAVRFAERSVAELADGTRGWASDHPFERPRIESWTSAIVLQFALAARDLQAEVQSRRTLSTFSVLDPRSNQWPGWLRWERLTAFGEPDPSSPLYSYLKSELIEPIIASPHKLPSGTDNTVSVLLFGPPGTSKTTVAKAVADALQWPVVQLSPGTFIERGLEAIEAEARSVFDRLQQLQRAVVLFDECDELFRDRDPSQQVEGIRTISAFVTGSMLPKLQDLHDSGRVVFVICTNHVSMIDPAIRRGGRIDHRLAVGPPAASARRRIIDEAAAALDVPAYWSDAADSFANATDRFLRYELRRGVRTLAALTGWDGGQAAREAAEALAEKMRPSLTVTETLYNSFLDDRSKYSDAPVSGQVDT
jgi:hypothetical protein